MLGRGLVVRSVRSMSAPSVMVPLPPALAAVMQSYNWLAVVTVAGRVQPVWRKGAASACLTVRLLNSNTIRIMPRMRNPLGVMCRR